MTPKVFISPFRRGEAFKVQSATKDCMQVCKTIRATADEFVSEWFKNKTTSRDKEM
jgi:hypothetical protein